MPLVHRRTLFRLGAALTGGAVMPTFTPAVTSPDDPFILGRQAASLRTAFATAGAAVLPRAQDLAEHVVYLDRRAVGNGDVRLADAYARLGADLGQWLALAWLKTGHGNQADFWATQAATMAEAVEDGDLTAVALCRRAGALKSTDPTRAWRFLDHAGRLHTGPWAAAMVAQHQAAVLPHYGPGRLPSALGYLDQAERHLTQAIKDEGDGRRPWWAGSAERPLSITFTGLDYRRAELMTYQHPTSATKLLDQVAAAVGDQATHSRAGVDVRRAVVARQRGDLDDAATLALGAWQALEPAGISRDMARVRYLAHLLGRDTDARTVRQLGEAVAGA